MADLGWQFLCRSTKKSALNDNQAVVFAGAGRRKPCTDAFRCASSGASQGVG
jgi:hypothetical protein